MTAGVHTRSHRGLRPQVTPDLRRYRRVASAVAVLLAAVAGWQLLVDSGVLDRAAVASPTDIARAARPILTHGSFWSALGSTSLTWALGWSVSLLIAVPVGLALGSSRTAYQATRFTIDFLRTIPPVALLPLALLLYGATDRMAVYLIVFGSVWPILLQSMYGVQQVDPVVREFARSYRLRRRDRFTWVVVPSALPFIATGARLASTMSLLLAIGVEVIGGSPGLGSQITITQQSGRIPEMFVYVVVCALLGVVSNLLLAAYERKVLSWHPSYRITAS